MISGLGKTVQKALVWSSNEPCITCEIRSLENDIASCFAISLVLDDSRNFVLLQQFKTDLNYRNTLNARKQFGLKTNLTAHMPVLP